MPIIAKHRERSEREESLYKIRHSTAHLMAEAVRALWPDTKLAFGPPVQDGFYYDFDASHKFTDLDLRKIEKRMKEIKKRKAVFEKRSISKKEALAFFTEQGERLKAEHVDTLTDGEITLYKSGEFIDLCAGPHVENVSELVHFRLLSVSGSYWRGDENRDQLQRIYGTAWDTAEALREYLERVEEAKKRDHRILGKRLELFEFPKLAGPGLPFYLPNGALVLHELKSWMWDLHMHGGYGHSEKRYAPLATPHILKTAAWHTSGHIQNYRENMFMVYSLDELDQGLLDTSSENEARTGHKEGSGDNGGNEGLGNYGLKPMNCPGHVMLFNVGTKSYRDLPLRYFEFGTVYRYERAGTLHGMLRVRSFTQDDAHIFCTPEQYLSELEGVFDFCCHILDTFGFDYQVGLKTRGEKRIGSEEIWDMAEDGLRQVLEKRAAGKYYVEEGDATFYGPKVDFVIKDGLGRDWQGGTIQLDFNLPERFDLEYTNSDGERVRPVMIHRAILGSFERFFGLLIEEFGGAFPLWMAPIQARVLPIGQEQLEYARSVASQLGAAGLRVEVDGSSEKLGKKIRFGKIRKIPYLVVIGAKEAAGNTVTVEGYFDGKLVNMTRVEDLILHMTREVSSKEARRRV